MGGSGCISPSRLSGFSQETLRKLSGSRFCSFSGFSQDSLRLFSGFSQVWIFEHLFGNRSIFEHLFGSQFSPIALAHPPEFPNYLIYPLARIPKLPNLPARPNSQISQNTPPHTRSNSQISQARPHRREFPNYLNKGACACV